VFCGSALCLAALRISRRFCALFGRSAHCLTLLRIASRFCAVFWRSAHFLAALRGDLPGCAVFLGPAPCLAGPRRYSRSRAFVFRGARRSGGDSVGSRSFWSLGGGNPCDFRTRAPVGLKSRANLGRCPRKLRRGWLGLSRVPRHAS
jgi:hypothetical protein